MLLMQHIPAHAEPSTVERVAKMPLSSMPFFFLGAWVDKKVLFLHLLAMYYLKNNKTRILGRHVFLVGFILANEDVSSCFAVHQSL